jgi:hypothetical protein
MNATIPDTHPAQLWTTADDTEHDTFTVEQIDVEPLDPTQPPAYNTPYRDPDTDLWKIHRTYRLGYDVFALKSEALYAAAALCDDEAYQWKKKAEQLEKEASRAEDQEADAQEAEHTGDTAATDVLN